jgi:hypothetical protein
MKSSILAMMTAVLVLTGAWIASGQMEMQKGMMPPGGKEPMKEMKPMAKPMYQAPFSIDALKEALGLSEEQVAKMKALRVAYEKERIKKEAEIKVVEVEFFELLDQKELDLPKIEAKLKQLGALQAELGFFRVKKLQDTRAFLSTDQFAKFKAYTQQAVGSRMGMKSMMGQQMKSGMMSPHPMGMGGMMGPGMMEMQGGETESK